MHGMTADAAGCLKVLLLGAIMITAHLHQLGVRYCPDRAKQNNASCTQRHASNQQSLFHTHTHKTFLPKEGIIQGYDAIRG